MPPVPLLTMTELTVPVPSSEPLVTVTVGVMVGVDVGLQQLGGRAVDGDAAAAVDRARGIEGERAGADRRRARIGIRAGKSQGAGA